jgi:hypothetical protein
VPQARQSIGTRLLGRRARGGLGQNGGQPVPSPILRTHAQDHIHAVLYLHAMVT